MFQYLKNIFFLVMFLFTYKIVINYVYFFGVSLKFDQWGTFGTRVTDSPLLVYIKRTPIISYIYVYNYFHIDKR